MLIRIDSRALKQLADRMGRMHGDGRLRRAITEGMREGGDKTRTAVRRALKAQTGVKAYKSITSRTRSFTEDGGLRYVIVGSGKGMPIKEFSTRGTRGPGGGVTSNPWAVQHKFKRSFVGSGKIAGRLLARLPGPGRKTIYVPGGMYGVRPIKVGNLRSLYGPSVAKEIVKDQSASAFFAGAETFVLDRIIVRVGRALG
jgi:hypothetical protein